MRVSVVVNTHNRAESLRTLLEALEAQSHAEFEVVVVDGPSTDGTAALLEEYAGVVRVASCPERNLSKSRNIGIDAAAGEVVAFVDDDAIPEATWLEELVAGYGDGTVSGVGGLVVAPSGVRHQYRYSLCDRLGQTSFPIGAPPASASDPGADPFLYLQGTNASFRRDALVEIGGFDEEIAYMYDESELCAMLVDAGHRLRQLEGAAVHHKFLPSPLRTAVGFTDPFHAVKNRAYLALRLGRERAGEEEIVAAQRRFVAESVGWAQHSHRQGGLTAPEVARYVRRAEEGLERGLERGRVGTRLGRAIAPAEPDAFLPFARRTAERPARIVFTSADYPPKSMAGIARFTVDLAEGMAARGHDVHVVTRDDEGPARVDFERRVWVHRYPVNPRFLPELDGSSVVPGLEQAAAIHSVVERIHATRPVDVVCGPLWGAETLVCALDPRLRVVTTCMTPLRVVAEMQERVAALPGTAAMIAMEDAVLPRSAHLVPVSAANARTIAGLPGVVGRPSTVLHHGVVDRRAQVRRRRDDDAVELLFVGRLEARKGVDVLLAAVVGVLRRHPRARLRLVGDDNAAWSAGEDWRRMLSELAGHDQRLVSRVAFAGRAGDEELLQALADADVFVAPSRYESFGLVVAEAMMMGLPVVSTAVGGIPEVAVDGETALLVAPGDAAALEDALDALVADAGLRDRLGAAGRARYAAVFDNEVVLGRYLDALVPGEPHERPVDTAADARAAGAELLDELVGLRGAAALDAADALLDGGRFPVDLTHALQPVSGADTQSVAAAALRAVLGRAPTEPELATAGGALGAHAPLRAAAEWALGAAGLETDLLPGAAQGLPEARPSSVLAAVRRAWAIADDGGFLAALVESLAVADDAALRELAARALAGEGRRAALRLLLETPRVERRVGHISGVDSAPLLTADELTAELRAIAGTPADAAIGRAFGLLMGRAPTEADRLDARRRFLLGSRAEWLHGLVETPSAVGYGSDPRVWHPLVDAVDGLARRPRGGALRRTSAVRRVELLARGVLSDLEAAGAAARAQPARQQSSRRALERAIRAQGDTAFEARDERLGALERGLETVLTEGRDAAAVRRASESALRDGVARADDRVRVLGAKYEALALDLRERLPAQVHEELPEPAVLDPRALEPGARVNLGCGEKPLEDYVNVDFRPLPGVAVVADVRALPFAPGSLAEVASHHLVEHFRQTHLEQVVLPHWRGLLRDDGVLRVVTPNLTVITEWFRVGRLTAQEFKAVLFGLQDYAGDDHFALYSPETLTEVVERAGFTAVELLETERPNGNSPEIELVARPSGR